MKKTTQHNPTMMIKSSFSNKIHKLLGECTEHKRHSKEWWDCMRESRSKKMTDEEKVKLFDEIKKVYNETSQELRSYFQDRSFKKRVQKERVKRGYVPKKKTKKEDNEKNLQNNLEIS
jgi:hypothetical protein